MQRLLLCALCAVALKAQSISITAPATGATVTGTSYTITHLLTSVPTAVKVCDVLDSYALYNPGTNAPLSLGCSITPPFSIQYNSFWNGNSTQHQLIATAYDVRGNVVATSSPVAFTIGNTWPLSYVAQLAATAGGGCTLSGTWSGTACTLTWTWSGSGSANSKNINFYIDGIFQASATTTTSATGIFYADTVQFQNGNHNLCMVGTDNVAGTTYTGSDGTYTGAATEWCRALNFQNGAVPSRALTNTSGIYLAPGHTFTLTAQALNTDGSTSAETAAYWSSNTNVATVNPSTGVVSGVAKGSTQINAGVLSCTATDLLVNGSYNNRVSSISCPFGPNDIGGAIVVTSGTGWTPGTYFITGTIGNAPPVSAMLNASPAATSSSGGHFSSGPARQSWVYVWPTNTMPQFSTSGTTLASFSSTTSFIPHCMFQAAYNFTNEQPYNPGAMADFNSSGLNCFEIGMIPTSLSGYTTSASFQSSVNSYISTYEGYVTGYPKLHFGLTGDNVAANGIDLYAATSPNSPQRNWSPPAFQYVVQQWTGRGNALGAPMIDENGPAYTFQPLAGPISYTASQGQSWLEQIVASGGTCTATTFGNWSISLGNGGFIIHGSSVANMNSVAPAVYIASAANNKVAEGGITFTFTCTGVVDGTFNASNDSGLVLEPLGNSWYNSNTDYIHYNAFADLYTQAHNVAGTFGLSYPGAGYYNASPPYPPGPYPAYVIGNWNGLSTQSLGSVTQPSDYADIYPSSGVAVTGGDAYLVSRESGNALLASVNVGGTLKNLYGTGYSPSIPLVALTESTQNYFGLQGYPVALTSCSGTLCTFSAPHGITNIVPGLTRIYITGATNSGSPADSANNNFYVWNCPSPTTCNLTLAATDFALGATGATGGTARFQDGSTMAIQTTTVNCESSPATCITSSDGTPTIYAGIAYGAIPGDIIYPLAQTGTCHTTITDPGCYRKRGQTFTLSGVSGSAASYFNSRTFLLSPWDLNLPAFPTGQYAFIGYTELPELSATGGTAYIVHNDNFIKGQGASIQLEDTNPGFSFGTCMETFVNRGVGDRWYQVRPYLSGYSDQVGFTSPYARMNTVFGGTGFAGAGDQLEMNEHFENSATRPIFEAASNCDTVWTRYQKYALQPTLNSPDTGQPWIDCTARAGSYGDMLVCFNASDGTQPWSLNISPYLQSGQQIIQQTVGFHSIGAPTILASGTASASGTLGPEEAVFLIFPVNFAAELLRPAIAPDLASIANSTDVLVRWSYHPYYLDSAGNIDDCGTGICTPTWDRNFGPVYYRLIYLGANSKVLATSAIQKF